MTEIAERVYATIIFTAQKNARLLLLLLKSSGTLLPLVMLISGFIYKSRADENTSSA